MDSLLLINFDIESKFGFILEESCLLKNYYIF